MIVAYQPFQIIPLHRHAQAYAAFVCEGGYFEFGPDGRWLCQPGDVVMHPRLDVHADRFNHRGGKVLDAPVLTGAPTCFCVLRPQNAEEVFRAMVRNEMTDAAAHLLQMSALVPPLEAPPGLETARKILSGPESTTLVRVANAIGQSREHVTRRFREWFGMTPGEFRREHRLRRALQAIDHGQRLAMAAAEAGYADQAHMTRSLRSSLGVTPGSLQAGKHHTCSKH
ncbi:MAG TPA: helix-turn-helix domain-containing protein [Steroidobacteraceae bacterium]|nr:helix-turn-helix domain-containing protein [Steroidobacteraceae bacterium]